MINAKYKKTIRQFAILLSILLFTGFIMQRLVGELLTATLERTIAKQTSDMAIVAEERFSKELSELRVVARYLESHSDEKIAKDFISELKMDRKGVTVGLLNLNGEVIQGDSIQIKSFTRYFAVNRGNEVVDYSVTKGLLFAVPVMNGRNVHAVLYRVYEDNLLSEMFGLGEYNSDSKFLIQERDGQIIIPYQNYGHKDKAFFNDRTVIEGFKKVRDMLENQQSAAIYTECKAGRYFLFATDLPQTNCTMIGFVPWHVVADDIFKIYTMLIIAGAFIWLTFAAAGAYLFFMKIKAEESDALREAKQAADDANKAKSVFLANMSHEIRTPINAVIGMNEMILRECKDPSILNYAQNSQIASESLLNLINDILDFSKIENGKMELVPQIYSLEEVIKSLVNMIKPRAENKKLKFTVNVAEDIENQLYGDSVRIRQIVINFLTNAVKYTKEGEIKFTVEKENRDNETIILKFRIKDTGIGIREEDKKRLFKDFERFDLKRNNNIEGTGLGLAISHKLVDMMNGQILVDSVYGKGSTFSVMIPQKIINKEKIGNFNLKLNAILDKTKEYQVSFTAPDAKILIVDDNEMNLLVGKNLLKAVKVKIDTAMSGIEALQKLAQNEYDIIFLDQMMPILDGVQTLKMAKALPENKSKNAPIIALTANAISGTRDALIREGFTDYLSKPIEPKLFEKMLMDYLPIEKLKAPAKEVEKVENVEEIPAVESVEKNIGEYINVDLGLEYSAGMADFYKEVLQMFCELKDEKSEQIQKAYDTEDWKNYAIFVHALKSTALSIGGEKLSDMAKQLEKTAKNITSPENNQQEIEFIKSHHNEMMKLYNETVDEGNFIMTKDNF